MITCESCTFIYQFVSHLINIDQVTYDRKQSTSNIQSCIALLGPNQAGWRIDACMKTFVFHMTALLALHTSYKHGLPNVHIDHRY